MTSERERKRRTLVQNFDRKFITFAFTAYDVLRRYAQVIEIECTGGGCTDAKLLLLLCYLDTHVFGCDKASYALVSFTWINLENDCKTTRRKFITMTSLTFANIRNISASWEFVIHILEPLITQ